MLLCLCYLLYFLRPGRSLTHFATPVSDRSPLPASPADTPPPVPLGPPRHKPPPSPADWRDPVPYNIDCSTDADASVTAIPIAIPTPTSTAASRRIICSTVPRAAPSA